MESYEVDIVVMDVDWERKGCKMFAYGSTSDVKFVEDHAYLKWEFANFTSSSNKYFLYPSGFYDTHVTIFQENEGVIFFKNYILFLGI